VAQALECLPHKYKTLNSNCSIVKRRRKEKISKDLDVSIDIQRDGYNVAYPHTHLASILSEG
jgi:hypothetical protein